MYPDTGQCAETVREQWEGLRGGGGAESACACRHASGGTAGLLAGVCHLRVQAGCVCGEMAFPGLRVHWYCDGAAAGTSMPRQVFLAGWWVQLHKVAQRRQRAPTPGRSSALFNQMTCIMQIVSRHVVSTQCSEWVEISEVSCRSYMAWARMASPHTYGSESGSKKKAAVLGALALHGCSMPLVNRPRRAVDEAAAAKRAVAFLCRVAAPFRPRAT
jgi:hypothetical protein